jgi:hypothetical protein
VISTVTVVVPARVNAIDIPPAVYPVVLGAFATSLVDKPAQVVVPEPGCVPVDKCNAIFHVSELMSNVPSSSFVLPSFVNVHAPAAIIIFLWVSYAKVTVGAKVVKNKDP